MTPVKGASDCLYLLYEELLTTMPTMDVLLTDVDARGAWFASLELVITAFPESWQLALVMHVASQLNLRRFPCYAVADLFRYVCDQLHFNPQGRTL